MSLKTKIIQKFTTIKTTLNIKLSNQIPMFYYSRVVNFGDILNVYMVEKLSKKKVLAIDPNTFDFKNYVVIGSVLSNANSKSVIWGTGIMFANSKIKHRTIEVHAVRGPKTRDLLLKSGIACPEIYGDPALLLPKLYSPKITKKYKLGIIPHYVDKNHPWVKSFSANENVKIIDIQNPDVESFVDEMLECENIVSSSLHGVIVGDAYGIPSMWVELSNKVAGSGFKFLDYFESVKRNPTKAKLITQSEDLKGILEQFDEYTISIDLEKLLKSCPFYKR